jgi:hypothetical protein
MTEQERNAFDKIKRLMEANSTLPKDLQKALKEGKFPVGAGSGEGKEPKLPKKLKKIKHLNK